MEIFVEIHENVRGEDIPQGREATDEVVEVVVGEAGGGETPFSQGNAPEDADVGQDLHPALESAHVDEHSRALGGSMHRLLDELGLRRGLDLCFEAAGGDEEAQDGGSRQQQHQQAEGHRQL